MNQHFLGSWDQQILIRFESHAKNAIDTWNKRREKSIHTTCIKNKFVLYI